jgi:hypothetical protein
LREVELVNLATQQKVVLEAILRIYYGEIASGSAPEDLPPALSCKAIASHTGKRESNIRVTAHEIRRRLSRYYDARPPCAEVRIELPLAHSANTKLTVTCPK